MRPKIASKYEGISFKRMAGLDYPESSRPWIIRLTLNKKQMSFGTFETEELAAVAYDYVLEHLFPTKKSKLNKARFPELQAIELPDSLKTFLDTRISQAQSKSVEATPVEDAFTLRKRGSDKTPPITKDELMGLISTKGIDEVSQLLGKSRNTINRWVSYYTNCK